jgi:integrase
MSPGSVRRWPGVPRVRLLPVNNARDRWLTPQEADRLLAVAPPHLQALIRFALATGCRAREITGLEWDRVDLKRRTAWLDQTKNGTPRGVPRVRLLPVNNARDRWLTPQ